MVPMTRSPPPMPCRGGPREDPFGENEDFDEAFRQNTYGEDDDDFDEDDCVPMCKIPTGSTYAPSTWDGSRDDDLDGLGNDFDFDGGLEMMGTNKVQAAAAPQCKDLGFFGVRKEPSARNAMMARFMELQQSSPPFEPPGLPAKLLDELPVGDPDAFDVAPTVMKDSSQDAWADDETKGARGVGGLTTVIGAPPLPGDAPGRPLPPNPPAPLASPPIPRKWVAQIVQDAWEDGNINECIAPPVAPAPVPPPGLAPPSPALPSLGSALHGLGHCKPCGWFRKPGGCKNGQLCHHCHICNRDDVKMRKKLKVQALKTQHVPKDPPPGQL